MRDRRVREIRRGLVTLGLLVLACAGRLDAQPSGPPISEPWPQEIGQWAGPWDLAVYMARDPQGAAYDPPVNEIAHSMLIPPREPETLQQSPYRGWVMFLNRRFIDMANPVDGPQPTFLWNPDDPGIIADEHHILLYGDQPGNQALDIFCSGHTYLGDGRPVTAGGQDNVSGSPLGQGQSYVLETRFADTLLTNPPYWQLLGSEQPVERWYPTVTTLADGNLLQVGNTPEPDPFVDPNTQQVHGCGVGPGGHPDCGDWWRSVFTHDPQAPGEGDWGPELVNRRFDAGLQDCETATPIQVGHYPRLHLLSSGELIWVDGREPTGLGEHVSYFLKVDPQAPADCTADPGNPFQWRKGTPALGDPHMASQKGAPTAHLLWPGALPGTWNEVIYQFGGTIAPHDDAGSCPPKQLPGESPTTRVARIVNPDTTTPWDIVGVDDMAYGRVNHNAVIQLDGSILVVGGLEPSEVVNGPCEPRKRAERFLPEELFPADPGPEGRWKDMAWQTAIRGYHSVAGLLPDGRVFSAGGRWPGHRYSVELYSPPYMFTTEPRPVILTSFASEVGLGEDLTFDVKLRGGGEVERIALVRPGSTTHAFDMSQRYVVLDHEPPAPMGNDTWRVTAQVPVTGAVTPPGWYLLTAIGGPESLPSVARWVKIELPE